ncbi:D-alanine--D-alanine ligase [bacterium]|nr:D-alanine--D-alanine ligase [bacterium]
MKIALMCNIKTDELKQQNGEFGEDILEWDDADTIDAVARAIRKNHEVLIIDANLNAVDKLKKYRPDLVFNIAEGKHGISREAQIPALLDMMQIPYTGSDVSTLVNTLDKHRCKEILSFNGVKNAEFVCVNDITEIFILDNLPDGKKIIKPCWEGSSKGVFDNSVFENKTELKQAVIKLLEKYNQPVLVEEFLTGREFTVAILGNIPDLQVLPIVEINFDALPKTANRVYSYEAKWVWDTVENPLKMFDCPAKLDKNLKTKIEELTKKAFSVMRCRDWCRIDVRLSENGEPNIIELNPLPGILPDPEQNSCFPKAARAAGLTYEDVINRVIDSAEDRRTRDEGRRTKDEKDKNKKIILRPSDIGLRPS